MDAKMAIALIVTAACCGLVGCEFDDKERLDKTVNMNNDNDIVFRYDAKNGRFICSREPYWLNLRSKVSSMSGFDQWEWAQEHPSRAVIIMDKHLSVGDFYGQFVEKWHIPYAEYAYLFGEGEKISATSYIPGSVKYSIRTLHLKCDIFTDQTTVQLHSEQSDVMDVSKKFPGSSWSNKLHKECCRYVKGVIGDTASDVVATLTIHPPPNATMFNALSLVVQWNKCIESVKTSIACYRAYNDQIVIIAYSFRAAPPIQDK